MLHSFGNEDQEIFILVQRNLKLIGECVPECHN